MKIHLVQIFPQKPFTMKLQHGFDEHSNSLILGTILLDKVSLSRLKCIGAIQKMVFGHKMVFSFFLPPLPYLSSLFYDPAKASMCVYLKAGVETSSY